MGKLVKTYGKKITNLLINAIQTAQKELNDKFIDLYPFYISSQGMLRVDKVPKGIEVFKSRKEFLDDYLLANDLNPMGSSNYRDFLKELENKENRITLKKLEQNIGLDARMLEDLMKSGSGWYSTNP